MAKDLSTLVVMVLRLQNDKKVLASMLEDSKTIWKETHALAARQGMVSKGTGTPFDLT